MRQLTKIGLMVGAVLLVGGSQVCAQSHSARADNVPTPDSINLTYHGGPLLQNVKVATLFWGQGWDGSAARDFLNSFFKELFDDKGFMANLSQYSDGGYQIGNGQLARTTTDSTELPPVVDDNDVPNEIIQQFLSGALPAPDADTLYVVFTPPGVTLKSVAAEKKGFILGYHSYVSNRRGDWFPYVIVPTPTDEAMAALQRDWGIHRPTSVMTEAASHELAEAVTDPRPGQDASGQVTTGWYDDNLGDLGEVGDIPATLFDTGQIPITDLFDVLTGADGTRYLVQKIWSNQDGAPVAFAQSVNNGDLKVKIGR
jgi:hypothetical protein